MKGYQLVLLEAATAPDRGGLGAGLSLWRILGAWLLCVGIAVALIFLLRRVRAGRAGASVPLFSRLLVQPSRQMEIVETRRATMAVDILLIDYRGERYFVASGPGGTTLLDRSPIPVAEPEG